MAALGLPFAVMPSAAPESVLPGEYPEATAVRLAEEKARWVAPHVGEALVVGCDTLVEVDGRVLGKPTDPPQAVGMLKQLRGREHAVISGLAVLHNPTGRLELGYVRTWVRMRSLTDAEIEGYVASGLPLDKAGAYGIQDDPYRPVRSVKGCCCNVVGLPVQALAQLLTRFAVATNCRASGCCAYPEQYVPQLCRLEAVATPSAAPSPAL